MIRSLRSVSTTDVGLPSLIAIASLVPIAIDGNRSPSRRRRDSNLKDDKDDRDRNRRGHPNLRGLATNNGSGSKDWARHEALEAMEKHYQAQFPNAARETAAEDFCSLSQRDDIEGRDVCTYEVRAPPCGDPADFGLAIHGPYYYYVR